MASDCVLDLVAHSDFEGHSRSSGFPPRRTDLASDDALDQWMLRNVSTMHHISCTAKMGPDSDPLAVVDQHGRVKGVQSLRLVDGSILPDCPRSNTNVPIMMLAERISDWIKAGQ